MIAEQRSSDGGSRPRRSCSRATAGRPSISRRRPRRGCGRRRRLPQAEPAGQGHDALGGGGVVLIICRSAERPDGVVVPSGRPLCSAVSKARRIHRRTRLAGRARTSAHAGQAASDMSRPTGRRSVVAGMTCASTCRNLIGMLDDPSLNNEAVEDPRFYAAVHAWRALGHFKAVEAVERPDPLPGSAPAVGRFRRLEHRGNPKGPSRRSAPRRSRGW